MHWQRQAQPHLEQFNPLQEWSFEDRSPWPFPGHGGLTSSGEALRAVDESTDVHALHRSCKQGAPILPLVNVGHLTAPSHPVAVLASTGIVSPDP